MKNSCLVCRFSRLNIVGVSVCARYPPTVVYIPEKKSVANFFPTTNALLDWCGEFKLRPKYQGDCLSCGNLNAWVDEETRQCDGCLRSSLLDALNKTHS